jgi:predicted membrane protein
MFARKSLILGAGLMVFGLLVLFAELSGENLVWILMPFVLIGLGLLLLISPTLVPSNVNHAVQFIGEYRQYYSHGIDDKAIYLGIGDVELDFSHIHLPPGETDLKITCFAGAIRLKFRRDFPYCIQSRAFVSEVREGEQKQDLIVDGYEKNSLLYAESNSRLRIQILSFVSDITIT